MYTIFDQITATTVEIDHTQDDVQEIETILGGLYEDAPEEVLDAITELAELLDGRDPFDQRMEELATFLNLDIELD